MKRPCITSVDLSNYVRVGRHSLPEPLLTALPAGTPAHNLLCQEASGVAYNWDTDTLFVVADGGRSVTQVSKTGVLIDTMTLALGSSPQGTEFYDIEGITYVGGGQFVMAEERDRQIVKFTYAAGTTLTRGQTQTVRIGTFVDNTGTEGLSHDPLTSGFVVLKEISPIGIFQTTVDFGAGTASNGSPSTVNSTDLFDPALLGMTDVADVFALSVLPSMAGQPQQPNLIVLSQEDGKLVNIDRSGVISSTRQIFSDPGNPLSVAGQQHEGVTMDAAGFLYIVNENGGGGIDFPELWVYAPATAPNAAPTGLSLNGAVTSVIENTSTASALRLGEVVVVDDGLGTNVLSLAGADAAFFELVGNTLFLKSGTILDFETKSSYQVTLQVDDASLGTNPDVIEPFTLTVTDQNPETPPPPALLITEVAPWSSGNSAVGSDWFEVTNISASAVDISGWKIDDSSKAFGSAVALGGVTSIAPGESVIFIETSDLAGKAALFRSHWFGSSPPASLQIGNYTGSGVGFGTSGDAVWLFDGSGQVRAGVTFGASPSAAPYGTFDNTAGLNGVAVSKLSVAGVNGALPASGSMDEIGSPGFAAPGLLRITEVAPWSSGNSPVGADWFEVTNAGARVVSLEGWKMDDSSESPVGAVALNGIAAIAPGESVIFLETETVAATVTAFLSNWFGANPPSGLQVGTYSGSGVGLSTGGDAVNLFDSTNVRQAKVTFGASPAGAPFGTFDNSALIDNAAVAQFSAAGVNGAFVATNSANEIGSPGTLGVNIAPSVSGGVGGSVTGGGLYAPGSTATFTATPDAGFAFAGWIVNGAPAGNANPLQVTVTAGLTVEATFVSGPEGTYEGRLPLYARFPDDSHLTNGYLSLKVSARGNLTGTVAFAGFVYRIPKGTLLDAEGTTPGVIQLTHRTGPPVELEITAANEFEISGLVNRVNGNPIEFGGSAGHALRVLDKYSATNPFPFAGVHTFGLERYREDRMTEPAGNDSAREYGYGLLKITRTGRATLRGHLPDGSRYTLSTSARAENGGLSVWVYAPILDGAGSVVGPIVNEAGMAPTPVTILSGGSGGWRWYAGDAVQPMDDRTWIDVFGSEYTPPAMGEPILPGGQNATNVKQGVIPGISPLGIDARDLVGTLPGAPDPALDPAPEYLATVENPASSPNEVTFEFNPANGFYRASFVHPGTGRTKVARGAVVQWDGVYEFQPDGGGASNRVLTGVEPGGHSGVFVNKVRQPDWSSLFYPGWLFHDILP